MATNLGESFAENLQWVREDSGTIRLTAQGESNGEPVTIAVVTFAVSAFSESDVKAWLQSVVSAMNG